MTVTYASSNVKKDKKGYYLTTENQDTENESINLSDFLNEKMQGVTITSNSTYTLGAWNYISSSLFNDVITAKNANHYIQLFGYGSKCVTTGDYDDTVEIVNTATNKINLGNGENTLYIRPSAVKNIINTGIDKDYYNIQGGNNIITDKGGDNKFTFTYSSKNNIKITGTGKNTFTISGGENNITSTCGINEFTYNGNCNDNIKTGSFNDKFDVLLMGNSSYLKLNSGAGDDELAIKSYSNSSSPSRITADLGTGNDKVEIIRDSSSYGVITDIKTGKGGDNLKIKAGLINHIDTGNDSDTVEIYDGKSNYISTGNDKDYIYIENGWMVDDDTAYTNNAKSIVKAGNGNDYISIRGGYNTIYGEGGKDEIIISGGENTIYGGNDNIRLESGYNTVYASSDTIDLIDGDNFISTLKGNNTINVYGGYSEYSNSISLTKGNNIVNLYEKTAMSVIDISAGKNKINVNNIDELYVNSTAKSKQIVELDGNKNSIVVFDVKNGDCNINAGTTSNTIIGGDYNEVFNVKGGSSNIIRGEKGNDTYNLYTGADTKITDTEGTNIINIKKGYSGMSEITETTSTSKIVLDKSYKLTNANNVKDNLVVTSDNSVTVFGLYTTSTGGFLDDSLGLMFDAQNEISDKDFVDNIIFNDTAEYYNIGGKNYKLDLTQLKSDLASWFADEAHSSYTTTIGVFQDKNEADINSLMAVYTKDTANCFVKADFA